VPQAVFSAKLPSELSLRLGELAAQRGVPHSERLPRARGFGDRGYEGQ
jgi:hypothetical protein